MNPTPPLLKPTLGDFIEAHSKLVTSIAAFIALTAFSSQIDKSSDIKLFFPGLTLLAAIILTFELHSKLPGRPLHWRLDVFSNILTLLTVAMAWYWVSQFPVLWVPVVGYVLEMGVFIGGALLLTHLLTKAVTTITSKLFKRSVPPTAMERISQTGFVLFSVVFVAGLIWAGHKLSSHPISVHIPIP
jgi:hypothetical protein